jgi:formylglycine-generating enzyme required for sulfatase activity
MLDDMNPRSFVPSLSPAAPAQPADLQVAGGEVALGLSGEDAHSAWITLQATGLNRFEAIAMVAPDDRAVAASLWLEALRLVKIPSGSFAMGSPITEDERDSNEGPQRKVKVRAFRMGATPITQGAWEALMGKNPSEVRGDPELPVTNVSWNDIERLGDGFLAKLNAATEGTRPFGTAFRLPTEAEWEYACRAGSVMAYPFGNDPETVKDLAWTVETSGRKIHPVSLLRPNAFGLHDMLGNVREWCQDAWHRNYDDDEAPTNGGAWLKEDEDKEAPDRVTRGGAAADSASFTRSAARDSQGPKNRNRLTGFRVVCAPERTTLLGRFATWLGGNRD